ncbi:hypothetical protein J0656_01440 [Muricauda ruestringensis]|uniref:Lipoprotein n=1 Tax=Flagellimonas aurea TaxID=2915619 RepID=A0ABS3FZZ9_9FLAO|nr:hypothetical protein [Allomuricauda aurea]MBO0352663.1 hypothetical protein [Allomuricauda aurea]
MKKIAYFLMLLIIVSCEKDTIETTQEISEEQLRKELGLPPSTLSKAEKQKIKENIPPIEFNSIEEAKEFFNNIKSLNYFASGNLDKLNTLSNKGKINIEDNQVLIEFENLIMSVPCDSQFLPPAEGCDDNDGGGSTGGCGSGRLRFSGNKIFGSSTTGLTVNNAFSFNNSNGVTSGSQGTSYISGNTSGYSYQHLSSDYITSGNSICHVTTGTLTVSANVIGVDIAYVEAISSSVCINPCTGGGTGLELFLTPVNSDGN